MEHVNEAKNHLEDQDDVGIASIEDFLDRIEDPDESILESFQSDFEIVKEALCINDDESDDTGSTEYQTNREKAKVWESDAGSVKPNKKSNDGFEDCIYKGAVDSLDFPVGTGSLIYTNMDAFTGTFDHGLRNRTGVRLFSGGDIGKISGTWTHGFLTGRARVEFTAGGYVEGIYKFGVLHGFAREFGIGGYLKEFSCYNNGVRIGWIYKGMIGGGYLIGKVDSAGELTGDDIAFVYPDFRAAIKGEFSDGVLKSGQECRVISSKQIGGVIVPIYSKPCGPFFCHDPASSVRICSQPLLEDPWERSMVEVRPSSLEQAGEGLFAKEDLPAKTIIALFAGVKLKTSTLAAQNRARSDYRIRLNADLDLDIPHECLSTSVYKATLAHKANHSFVPNATFDLMEHPRFGLIRALSSTVDIAKDEEILVNYNLGLAKGPAWYKLLWLRHVRKTKNWSDMQVERYLERSYDMTMKRVVLPEEDHLQVPDPVGATDLTLEEENQERGEDHDEEDAPEN